MVTHPVYPLLTADEFLDITFGDRKAELDNGVVRMMDGGTGRHVRVAGNILMALAGRLRGTGYAPYNSTLAAKNGSTIGSSPGHCCLLRWQRCGE